MWLDTTVTAGATSNLNNQVLGLRGNLTNNGALIPGTGTVQLTGSGTQTIGGASSTTFYNLTISNAAGVTLSQSETVNGTLTLSNGNLGVGANTLTLNGGVTCNGKSINSDPTGQVRYFSSGAQQVCAGSYGYLSTATSGVKTLQGTATIRSDLRVGFDTTLDLVTYTANRSTPGGALIMNPNASLLIGGTNSLPSNYSTHAIDSFSTIVYGGAAQTVATLNSAQTYGHLTLSGSGNKTLGGNVTVVGTFTLGSGATAVVGSNTLTLYGTVTCGGSVTSLAAGTVGYGANANQTVCTGTYGNLQTASGGAKTLGGAVTVLTNMTIGSGTTLDVSASNYAMTITGAWTNNGAAGTAFTARSGTVTFNGSAAQTISGNRTDFNIMTINSTATVVVPYGTTQSRATTVNNYGTLQQATAVGSGATVNFLQIRNPDGQRRHLSRGGHRQRRHGPGQHDREYPRQPGVVRHGPWLPGQTLLRDHRQRRHARCGLGAVLCHVR